jgi:hypothetical protein
MEQSAGKAAAYPVTRRNNVKIIGWRAESPVVPINPARYGCAINVADSSELRVTGELYQIVSLRQ